MSENNWIIPTYGQLICFTSELNMILQKQQECMSDRQ